MLWEAGRAFRIAGQRRGKNFNSDFAPQLAVAVRRFEKSIRSAFLSLGAFSPSVNLRGGEFD